MVIRGGENIYPREIEEFLFTHPDVADVSVVGVPDLRFGEELCAWVKVHPGKTLTEDELRDYCRGKLAHFKVPRYVRFVDEFPMTVTGSHPEVQDARGLGGRLRVAGSRAEQERVAPSITARPPAAAPAARRRLPSSAGS